MRCVRDNANKIVSRGEVIPLASERDIFAYLGLAYKEPWERPLFDRKTMILRPIGGAAPTGSSSQSRSPAEKNATTTTSDDAGGEGPSDLSQGAGRQDRSVETSVSLLGKRQLR